MRIDEAAVDADGRIVDRETLVMPDLVHLDRRTDGVAVVTLANGKVNALSQALLADLRTVVDELAADPPGAVVVTGGERIFAAGADISEFGGPDEAAGITATIHGTLDALANLPRFVIAAVSGYALGGGCELALCADFRVCGDNAKLGQPEILLGVIPGAGGTQRLPRLVGPARAKDIIYSGRFVAADEALRIGLVDRVVPADEVYAAAREMAARFVGGPALALRAAKEAVDRGLESDLDTGLEVERLQFAGLFATEDRRTGMESFVADGPGKAVFQGR